MFRKRLGMPVLRMFGTQGIVVIGLILAWNIKRLQIEDGLRRTRRKLESPALQGQSAAPLSVPGRCPFGLWKARAAHPSWGSDIAQSMGETAGAVGP